MFAALAVTLGACSATLSERASCVAGETKACTCPSGAASTALCSDKGVFAACSCAVADMAVSVEPDMARTPVCGDNMCNGTENCLTCEGDCGKCPACNYAPSCTDAVGVPINPTVESNLNDPGGGPWTGTYGDGGVALPQNCGPAKLRIRLVSLTSVHSDDDSMYCIVQATDTLQSGAALTNPTGTLNDGQPYFFAPSSGVFWGQVASPDGGTAQNQDLVVSKNNITITYDCFVVDSSSWTAILQAAANAAGAAGQFGGAYGWAFGLGDVGLSVASAVLAANTGDKHLFNAQQTIDKNEFLDLTNGRTWQIERKTSHDECGHWYQSGGSYNCDWKITLESWGCATAIPSPPG